MLIRFFKRWTIAAIPNSGRNRYMNKLFTGKGGIKKNYDQTVNTNYSGCINIPVLIDIFKDFSHAFGNYCHRLLADMNAKVRIYVNFFIEPFQ